MALFLKKIKNSIAKTRTQVFDRIGGSVKKHKKISEELLDEIEEILISGDVGVDTTLEIIDRLRYRVKKEKYEDPEQLFFLLKEEILRVLPENPCPDGCREQRPHIILVVGVNGSGKTTSIAKLTHLLQQKGRKVLLAAADTFRAAAIEQLQEWARRLNVDVIRHQSGADPAAVVFDAVQAAKSRDVDVLIIDTAGRLHTRVNLMEELRKVRRTIRKAIPDAPHEVLLVLDATTGQNALNQARQFVETVGVTGIILAKLDGTAKGGAVIGITHQLKIPVNYVGLGEKIDDFEVFNAAEFVEGLFSGQEVESE